MKKHDRHPSAKALTHGRIATCALTVFLGAALALSCSSAQRSEMFPSTPKLRPLPPTAAIVIEDCRYPKRWDFLKEQDTLKRYLKQGYYFVGRGGESSSAGPGRSAARIRTEARLAGGNLVVCTGDITSKDKRTESNPYDVDKNWQVKFRKREYVETTHTRSYLLFRSDRGVPRQLQLNAGEKKSLEAYKRDTLAGIARLEAGRRGAYAEKECGRDGEVVKEIGAGLRSVFQCRRGKKNGKETVFLDGRVSCVNYYSNGVLNGKKTCYHKSGKTASVEPYSNGNLHGKVERFNENGAIINRHVYKNGRQLWTEDYESGRLAKKEVFENGWRVCLRETYRDGKLVSRVRPLPVEKPRGRGPSCP